LQLGQVALHQGIITLQYGQEVVFPGAMETKVKVARRVGNYSTVDFIDCHYLQMRNACHYDGLNLSANMCFGLAGSLDFLFWIEKKSIAPHIALSGRKSEAVAPFFEAIGTPAKKLQIPQEDLDEQIISCIDHKQHLFVLLDRYYLEYLREYFPPNHFGMHIVSIVGIRESDKGIEYAVHDFHQGDPVWVSSATINTARQANCQPLLPDNYCYIIDEVQPVSEDRLRAQAKLKIAAMTEAMISSKDSGLSAFELFNRELESIIAADLGKYEKVLKFQLKVLETFTRYDDTKSFYRRAYAEFLKECSETFGFSPLKPFTERAFEIADTWAQVDYNDADVRESLQKALKATRLLYAQERAFFEDMSKVRL
jgi:hypothetical protein